MWDTLIYRGLANINVYFKKKVTIELIWHVIFARYPWGRKLPFFYGWLFLIGIGLTPATRTGNCTNATDTTGWTEFPRPMVKVSIFCRRRCCRCFRAFLFVKMKPTRSRLISNLFEWVIANMFMVRFASNVRAIDMLRVENGMVLVIVGELLTWAESGLWQQRTKISEQKRKRRARTTKIAWT